LLIKGCILLLVASEVGNILNATINIMPTCMRKQEVCTEFWLESLNRERPLGRPKHREAEIKFVCNYAPSCYIQGSEGTAHEFLTSALDSYPSERALNTHYTEASLCPRATLNAVRNRKISCHY
jgi:hypothetical protein